MLLQNVGDKWTPEGISGKPKGRSQGVSRESQHQMAVYRAQCSMRQDKASALQLWWPQFLSETKIGTDSGTEHVWLMTLV